MQNSVLDFLGKDPMTHFCITTINPSHMVYFNIILFFLQSYTFQKVPSHCSVAIYSTPTLL
jgi:hypothetical protein